jgi:hypothetical protein
MRKTQIFALIIAAIVLIAVFVFRPWGTSSGKSLAQCLTEKAVTMYGSDLCEQCQNQKKIFGDDFKNINYVNCDFHSDECRQKGITVYPVWSYGNQVMVGVQSAETLSKFAAC